MLAVLYLVFNEGYLATGPDTGPVRHDLTAEAIRLTRLIRALLPPDGEVAGLLALMLLTEARRTARVSASGVLIAFNEQDRGAWDAALIAEGHRLVRERLAAYSGTNVSLWALAPAFFVIGVGIGLSFATIPVVALGDAKPDEAGSAGGSFSSIQQLASAVCSAAVTSIFFQAATSGLGHAMKVSLPAIALMPRKARSEPQR
ncbi:DUF6596 domain-containing protein [Microtetraspora malaysiensis]|uniref:DUF6596 domain-containing protein n=1 Tax=Microtetraspora malaysiensis TaxID=161358 RepID=UPI003D8C5AFC